jgi:hypothetical protein
LKVQSCFCCHPALAPQLLLPLHQQWHLVHLLVVLLLLLPETPYRYAQMLG